MDGYNFPIPTTGKVLPHSFLLLLCPEAHAGSVFVNDYQEEGHVDFPVGAMSGFPRQGRSLIFSWVFLVSIFCNGSKTQDVSEEPS